MTKKDLTQPDVIRKDYYNLSKNTTTGNKRQDNIIKAHFNKETNIWEIKSDYSIRINGNVYFELEQILINETSWRKSGLSLSTSNLWLIVIPSKEDKDCKNPDFPYVMLFRDTIIKKIKKYLETGNYEARNRNLPLPYYVNEGDKPYHTYVKDKKEINGILYDRYNRGVLIPLDILINPYYLEE